MDNKINIAGINIDSDSEAKILEKISNILYSSQKSYIVTPNPEFIIEAWQNDEFRIILNQADIQIPDGIGLLWAAKFLSLKTSHKQYIKIVQIIWQYIITLLAIIFYPRYIRSIIFERIAGSDLIWKIIEIAAEKEKSIFMLGGQEGVAADAAQAAKLKYPNLKIAGAQSGGYPIKDYDPELISDINTSSPDIIFVALGAPKQEKWIYNNIPKLNSVKLAMGVGGAFDFISGKIKRAPNIFKKLGIEWFYRLIVEPKRIKRIYNATVIFTLGVIRYKYKLKDKI